MKFKAKVSGLTAGTAAAIEVATKNVVKDFEHVDKVRVACTVDELSVQAWNGRMCIEEILSDLTMDLGWEHSKDGIACVNAKDLGRVLSSFKPDVKLDVELKDNKDSGKELVLSLESDKKQYQTLPCYDDEIDFPSMPKGSDGVKEININRGVFLRGVGKILFAAGFEEQREKYLYWVLRAEGENARFAAGTGQRFAILDVEGKNVFGAKPKKHTFMMPKAQTPVLVSILGNLDDDNITIKEIKNDNVFQLAIETARQKMLLLGMNPSIDWIDENVVLSADYTFKFVTEISDWKYASKGATATFDEQLKKEKRPHKAHVKVHPDDGDLFISTDHRMKSARKVGLIDFKGDGDGVEFVAGSSYISEIAENADEDGYIQMEFIKTVDEKRKPVLVRYFAADKVADGSTLSRINASSDTKESFSIFFSQLSG